MADQSPKWQEQPRAVTVDDVGSGLGVAATRRLWPAAGGQPFGTRAEWSPVWDREPLNLDLSRLGRVVVITTQLVLGLGILRELVIAWVGTETILEDLRQIALDVEHSLPAWYSSLLMVACALLLFSIARFTRRDGGRDVLRWSLLALIFAAMAIDEAVSFHEVLIAPVHDLLGTSGIFHFAWVIPGAIGVTCIGLYFLPFLFTLPRRTAAFFAVSGAIYVGGALGTELVGGALIEAYGMQSLYYVAAVVVEEGLEMAGLTCFLLALGDYIGQRGPNWASFNVVGFPRPGMARRARPADEPAAISKKTGAAGQD